MQFAQIVFDTSFFKCAFLKSRYFLAIEGAVFALLGLLIAFTFTGAA